MWGGLLETFFSKAFEKLLDYGQSSVTNVTDYQLTLRTLERNLRSLTAKASDVQEEVTKIELSTKRKRKREVENWLEEVQKLQSEFSAFTGDVESRGFISRFLGGDQANNLIARVEGLVEQSRHFGELLLPIYESEGVPLLTRRWVGQEFGENFEKIWKFLVLDKMSFVGIHGMPGVGKTSLAKHIHNQFLKESYDCVLWITISQVISIRNLQDEVADAIHLGLSDERNEDKRAARINQALSRKKSFLFILDDLWESINLEKLGDPLSLDGGKLIITTRSMEVCNQLGCQKVVKVETLNENDALKLFKETLAVQMELTPQVEEIATRMTEKCGGLPLGIITTAGSMKGVSDIHEWRNALAELDESLMREDNNGSAESHMREDNNGKVFKILKYSFDRLDRGEKRSKGYTTLQHCFLYCCLYPEDYRIERGELVDMFSSEGLLDKRRSRRAREDQGHTILNKLVNVCLLEDTTKSFKKKCVKMHDLIRAMALKITEGKYLRVDDYHWFLKGILDEEEHSENDLEKISVKESDIIRLPDGWTPNCPNLSTLLLNRNWGLRFIPSSFFLKMPRLHVLNLSETGINELPNSLSNLSSLKALILQSCDELRLMPDLRNLKKLRELNLSGTFIKEVPQGMEELVKLEYLNVGWSEWKKLPSNLLLNFQNLQYLHLPFCVDAPVKEIERLKQLEKFEGHVKNIFDFNRLMRGQASMQYGSYRIHVGRYSAKQYVEKRIVYFVGTNLNRGGRGNVIVLPHTIQNLMLERCEGLSNCLLDDLECPNINLQSLECLEICNCKGIECLIRLEELLMAEGASNYPFQNLKRLELRGLPDLMGVGTFQRGGAEVASPPPTLSIFSSLTKLLIIDCNKMKKLGLPLWELQSLEHLVVESCEEIEEIIEVGGDEDGEGNHYQPPVVHLPKLIELELMDLPRLKSICKASMVCVSIREITIKGCRRVKKLPLVFEQLDNDSPLGSDGGGLKIRRSEREWWESLELEEPSLRTRLQPFLKIM